MQPLKTCLTSIRLLYYEIDKLHLLSATNQEHSNRFLLSSFHGTVFFSLETVADWIEFTPINFTLHVYSQVVSIYEIIKVQIVWLSPLEKSALTNFEKMCGIFA